MKFFLLILLSIIAFAASAQFIFTPKKPVRARNLFIDPYEASQLKDSVPFSCIRIIDSRYDTTSIGVYADGYIVLKDSSQSLALLW